MHISACKVHGNLITSLISALLHFLQEYIQGNEAVLTALVKKTREEFRTHQNI